MLPWSPWRNTSHEGRTIRNSFIVFKFPCVSMILCRGLANCDKNDWSELYTINKHSQISAYQRTCSSDEQSRILWWVTLLCHVDYILRVRKDHIPNSCNTRGGREGGRGGVGGWVLCVGCSVKTAKRRLFYSSTLDISHKQPNEATKERRAKSSLVQGKIAHLTVTHLKKCSLCATTP